MNSFCPLIKSECKNNCMFYSGKNTHCGIMELLFEVRKLNNKTPNQLQPRSESGNGFVK